MRESEIAAAKASDNDSHQRELAPSRTQEQKEERKKKKPNGPPVSTFPGCTTPARPKKTAAIAGGLAGDGDQPHTPGQCPR
eukprot:3245897-Pyramimonas_sp.AAC.1